MQKPPFTIKYIEGADLSRSEYDIPVKNVDGRNLGRKSVGSDKVISVGTVLADSVDTAAIQDLAVTTAKIAALAVTTAKIAAAAVTQAKLSYETADITITGTSTSGTATVTSGSIPVGYFLTAFTTPSASYVQLVVSSTTLTVTLSTAPGVGNSCTIRCILLKS
mgnify:CR=1 FL=1